jgi:hypothetical protein
MNSLQIFIVFHKNIFDECYKNIPNDILSKYFTFIAVNEKIAKNYTRNKYKVINEWELPIYDKTFQERGYNENSAIYHIYANNLHKDYKYIGFFQYDMTFNDNIIDFYKKNLSQEPMGFYFSAKNYYYCAYKTWDEPKTLRYIIKDYEKFYNKTFSKDCEYPLYNSYIIPIEIYEKIMPWVIQLYDKLYPWCIQSPNASHFAHIGGIYERIMAFAIGEETLQNINVNVSHINEYKQLSY